MDIVRIREHREIADEAAKWFHSKWGISLDAYAENINECLCSAAVLPQWYLAVEDNEIVGGVGVIENDFHDRWDLTPNVCALYVEENHRCKGIAGALLRFLCEDMKVLGIEVLYLITDHTSFYERYGWEFLCMVQGEGDGDMMRMYVHKIGA